MYFSYSFEYEYWTKESAELIEPRVYAAGIQLQNGSWWFTGGMSVSGWNPLVLKSTEILSMSNDTRALNFTKGIDLKIGMNGHCITRLNSTHIFIGGGQQLNTYLFNEITSEFVELPKLEHRRFRPACAPVKYDIGEGNIETVIMVVGGFDFFDARSIFTTEYIDPTNATEWKMGPELKIPHGWSNGGYISNSSSTPLILVSGINKESELLDHIYHYNETNQQFDQSISFLSYAREYPGVVSIPKDEINCDNATKSNMLTNWIVPLEYK